MISAGTCCANSSATAVLPTAVGPVITRACEKENRRSITGREFLTRRFPAPQTMRFSKNCNENFLHLDAGVFDQIKAEGTAVLKLRSGANSRPHLRHFTLQEYSSTFGRLDRYSACVSSVFSINKRCREAKYSSLPSSDCGGTGMVTSALSLKIVQAVKA